MKNRERLMKMAQIDMLTEINSKMPCYCVVQALGDETKPVTCDNKCYDCISEFLNEEVRK